MTTRTFGQDFNALSHSVGEGLAAVGAVVRHGLKGMTPLGRRFAVTAFGAVLALGLGAATASAFRLPSEITDPSPPRDQALVQSELPSETAARTNALENPPAYTTTPNRADDVGAPADPLTVAAAPEPDDAAPAPAVYTTSSDDPPADSKRADAAAATPGATTDAND